MQWWSSLLKRTWCQQRALFVTSEVSLSSAMDSLGLRSRLVPSLLDSLVGMLQLSMASPSAAHRRNSGGAGGAAASSPAASSSGAAADGQRWQYLDELRAAGARTTSCYTSYCMDLRNTMPRKLGVVTLLQQSQHSTGPGRCRFHGDADLSNVMLRCCTHWVLC